MSNEKEENNIGNELREIVNTPTDKFAQILNVSFDAAKLIQSLISDFLIKQEE